jgi:hypothetical protein
MDDLRKLIDEYEKAKSEQAAAYKKMVGSEPQLYQLWERVQSIRKQVTEEAEKGIQPNIDLWRIGAYGPEIVQNAFKANERLWLNASQKAAEKLEDVIKRLPK